MYLSVLRSGVVLFLVLLFVCNCKTVVGSSDEAYVTLLYGDEFVLGVRVLGKSIKDTKSNKKDMVVLVSDGVSDYSKNLLQVCFWLTFFFLFFFRFLIFLLFGFCVISLD